MNIGFERENKSRSIGRVESEYRCLWHLMCYEIWLPTRKKAKWCTQFRIKLKIRKSVLLQITLKELLGQWYLQVFIQIYYFKWLLYLLMEDIFWKTILVLNLITFYFILMYEKTFLFCIKVLYLKNIIGTNNNKYLRYA